MAFKILIVGIGRRNEMLESEIDRYRTMTRPFAEVEVRYAKPPVPGSADRQRVLGAEAEALSAQLPDRCYAAALSDEGKQLDSRGFARWLNDRREDSLPLAFVIGGAHGLSADMKKECRTVLSLSRLTYSHRIAMVVLLEQIYRASTILTGHPYHK